MKRFHISKKQYEEFQSLQIRSRSDWPAVFSTNAHEEVWPFVCYGRTPKEDRQYVPLDRYRLLSDIAGNLVNNVDEDGGRFFINEQGVFFIKGEIEGIPPKQFIEWRPDEPLSDGAAARKPAPVQKMSDEEIYERMLKRQAAARSGKR